MLSHSVQGNAGGRDRTRGRRFRSPNRSKERIQLMAEISVEMALRVIIEGLLTSTRRFTNGGCIKASRHIVSAFRQNDQPIVRCHNDRTSVRHPPLNAIAAKLSINRQPAIWEQTQVAKAHRGDPRCPPAFILGPARIEFGHACFVDYPYRTPFFRISSMSRARILCPRY